MCSGMCIMCSRIGICAQGSGMCSMMCIIVFKDWYVLGKGRDRLGSESTL
jgi:hypothetical protein